MVEPLTCTQKDETWSMILPPVTTEDISPVEVKLLDADSFDLTGGVMSLETLFTTCPDGDSITLNFKLTSAVLGSNEQSISVPVTQPEKVEETSSEAVAFAGVVIEDDILKPESSNHSELKPTFNFD